MQNENHDESLRWANIILDAVREGRGSLYTLERINWALAVCGEITVAENAPLMQNHHP